MKRVDSAGMINGSVLYILQDQLCRTVCKTRPKYILTWSIFIYLFILSTMSLVLTGGNLLEFT